MPDHFYGVDKGNGLDPSVVVAGTASTPAKHIELRTLDGAGLTRMEVLQGLRTLTAYFQQSVEVTP